MTIYLKVIMWKNWELTDDERDMLHIAYYNLTKTFRKGIKFLFDNISK